MPARAVMKRASRRAQGALETARGKFRKGRVSKFEDLTPQEIDQALLSVYEEFQRTDEELSSLRPLESGKTLFHLADFLSQTRILRKWREELQRDLRQLKKLKRKHQA